MVMHIQDGLGVSNELLAYSRIGWSDTFWHGCIAGFGSHGWSCLCSIVMISCSLFVFPVVSGVSLSQSTSHFSCCTLHEPLLAERVLSRE